MGKLLLFLLISVASSEILALCPSNSFPAPDGNCYISINSSSSWGSAESLCKMLNGYLVVPQNAFDNTGFTGVIQSFGYSYTWLGAFSDQNSNWFDDNGTLIVYSNFASGQKYNPNKCAAMSQNGLWFADDCQYLSWAICRLSSSPLPPLTTTTTRTMPTTRPTTTTTTTRPSTTTRPYNSEINCPGYNSSFQTTPCPYGWRFLLKTCSCYLMTTSTYTWFEAEQYCVGHKGHLASIHNNEEALYVMSLSTQTQREIQVGLQYIGNTWLWSDGTPVDYLNWAPRGVSTDFSKNACTYVLSNGYYFASYMGNGPCTTRYSHAVCKKPLM